MSFGKREKIMATESGGFEGYLRNSNRGGGGDKTMEEYSDESLFGSEDPIQDLIEKKNNF